MHRTGMPTYPITREWVVAEVARIEAIPPTRPGRDLLDFWRRWLVELDAKDAPAR